MNHEQIIRTIKEFMIDEFEVDEDKITPDANLKSTLGLDSLDYIDLVVVIESNFAFKVRPGDFTGIVTFSDFYDYVIHRVHTKELA